MKPTINSLLKALLISSVAISSCKKEYQNGDNPIYGTPGPAGGIIFYDKGHYSDGWRYLEAAPFDQATGIVWGCDEMSVSDVKYVRDIGKGKTNTQAIITAHTTTGTYTPPNNCGSITSYAAKACDDFSLNGYSDWFLPSVNEFDVMFSNLLPKSLGNFESQKHYWTSTEAGAGSLPYLVYSWAPYEHSPYFQFNAGSNHHRVKASVGNVRAIRAY